MRQNFSLEMKKYIFFFGLFEQNFVRASSNLLDMTNQQEWFNIQKVWEKRKESKEKGLFRYKGASKAKVLKTLTNHASKFCLKK